MRGRQSDDVQTLLLVALFLLTLLRPAAPPCVCPVGGGGDVEAPMAVRNAEFYDGGDDAATAAIMRRTASASPGPAKVPGRWALSVTAASVGQRGRLAAT